MRRSRGFTLIEVMTVLAIVSLFVGGVIVSARSIAKSDLRGAASQMASGIRYLFDRARSTGKYYRLVIDMDTGRYWAEESDDRFLLVREKERSVRGRGPDEEEQQKQEQQRQAQLKAAPTETDPSGTSLDDLFDSSGQLKLGQSKAVFKSFKDTTLKPVELKKSVRVADVYTPKQTDPYSAGRAYLYFFPQGFGERAIIHLSDGKDSFYSLLVHPLTGRVQVSSGYLEIPRDFERRDDQGNLVQER